MTDAEATRSRRRKQAVVGIAGLAALLGGGTFLATALTGNDSPAPTTEVAAPAAVAPTTAVAEPSSAAPVPAATTTPADSADSAPPSRVPTTKPKTKAQIIEEVKGSAARAAKNVKRPLPQYAGAAAEDVTVMETGSLKTGGTMKVVSAKSDLTGQRELAIVGDEGAAVGAARCTNKVRFIACAQAVVKPTMLICWRTSATKSVYTVAVAPSGRPDADVSAAAIARQWSKLG